MNLDNLMTLRFNPALGWPAGLAIAAIMIGFAIAVVVVHRRRKDESDETLWACVRRCAICVIIAILALTPSTIASTTSRAVNTTDVIIATDVTGSMAVDDAQYATTKTMTRLEAAKKAIDDLTGIYDNSSFAAVHFGASATMDVPLTPDIGAIRNWASGLNTEPTAVSAGSNLDAPIDPLLVTLKQIRTAHPHDKIVLYYISDGEQTSAKPRRTFSSLRQYLDDAFTLAVGSEQGGQIPEIKAGPTNSESDQSDTDEEGWVNDPATGQPGISKMDKKNLTEIADEMGGKCIVLDGTHKLDKSSVASISKHFRTVDTPKRRERVMPLVWPFSIALAALLAMEMASWLATSRRLL
ncbi:VWA domain-containing protein [Bifidobacterium sp. ESL0784]|uniref:vWA domain-containing protein n=1 Tax=Bifidobacterium sp. ESL0784 TaxID=2983231 RepID=UPI0023F6F821|nr:vWA domain-containing protein [Bifidobacterium sp. ESL0784]MDF7640998.1 VWA domain-containing protein [Bifidobacterium sp. ESL0784]